MATQVKEQQLIINILQGWLSAAFMPIWTYSSGNVFTLSSTTDYSGYFPKGTRIKLTNNGVTVYGTVISSSFATNTTTVTLAPNSDYSLANFAITNPFYSYQASPQGYPIWFSYVPTWTGFSANPTPNPSFSILGNQITILFNSIAGTSNSATFTFTAPVVAVSPSGTLAYAMAVVDSSGWVNGTVGIMDGSATISVGKTVASISANAFGGFTTSGTKGLSGMIAYKF